MADYWDYPLDGGWLGTVPGGGSEAAGEVPVGNTPASPGTPYVPPPAGLLGNCPKNDTIPGALTGAVQRFEDLPGTPGPGLLYKVAGGTSTSFVPYYVVSQADGTWAEARAPALVNSIDPLTMPHALVRKSDGTFIFAPFCWAPRQIGDAKTNPAPAFVGRSIRDVFFYQNRLGFLADESAVMSVVGDYGNFWRRTVLDYLDTDVLSIAATTTDVALLEHATTFNDGIMLFSAQRQFSLATTAAGTSLSTIEINPVTEYDLAPGVRPAPFGDRVYFASSEGGHTAVQEYTRLDGRDAKGAADITAHVPTLIPAGASQIIPLRGLNGLVVLAARSDTPTQAYAYQFYWDGNQKVLSAWRRWTFGAGEVISGTFADGRLSLIMRRDDKAYLERVDLRPGQTSEGQGHLLYLDRQVTLTGTFNSGTGKTTFTFPYAPDPRTLRMLRSETGKAESIIDGGKIAVVGNTVTVTGDESAAPVTCGEAFRTAFRLSRQYPLDYQGRPLDGGRLQLRSMTVDAAQTPFYAVEIQPYGPKANLDDVSKTRTYYITSQRIGSSAFILGQQAYDNNAVPFLVGADASVATVTLVNDTPFSSYWVSAEWQGLFFSRAR